MKKLLIYGATGYTGSMVAHQAKAAGLNFVLLLARHPPHQVELGFGCMPLKLAMRFDRPKKAVMAAMSQMSSSSKPCGVQRGKSASSISCERSRRPSSQSRAWRAGAA
jgi:hypothetical protein